MGKRSYKKGEGSGLTEGASGKPPSRTEGQRRYYGGGGGSAPAPTPSKVYVIKGKTVSREVYEQETARQLAEKGKPTPQQSVTRAEQVQRQEEQRKAELQRQAKTRAIEAMSPATQEAFLKKATPQEKAELLRGSRVTTLVAGKRKGKTTGSVLLRKEVPKREVKTTRKGLTYTESKKTETTLRTELREKREAKEKERIKRIEAVKKPIYSKERAKVTYQVAKEKYKKFKEEKYKPLFKPLPSYEESRKQPKEKYYSLPGFKSLEKAQKFSYGIGKGGSEYVKEKPIGAAATGASFMIGGTLLYKGVGYVGKSAAWVANLAGKTKVGAYVGKGVQRVVNVPLVKKQLGKIGSAGIKVGGVGLGVAYVSPKVQRFREAKTPEAKGAVVGETAVEVGMLGLGAGAVSKGAGVGGTLLRKKQPVDVQYGYPTAPVEKHMKLFKETKTKDRLPIEKTPEYAQSYAAYTAISTPKFKTTVTPGKARKGESVGQYTSPTFVSGEFLGISDAYGGFGLGIPRITSPMVARTYPKGLRFGRPGITPTKPGYLYVPREKSEIQAVYPVGTQFRKVGKEYYFKTRGKRVPVDRYQAFSSKEVSKLSKEEKGKLISYKELKKSYGVKSSAPKVSGYNLKSLAKKTSGVSSKASSSIGKYSYKPSSAASSAASSVSKSLSKSYAKSSASKSLKSSAKSSAKSLSKAYPSGVSSYGKSYKATTPSYIPYLRKGRQRKVKFGTKTLLPKTRPYKYAPSITAIGFGIKTTKMPSMKEYGFGQIRPIVEPKTKKRKKGGLF